MKCLILAAGQGRRICKKGETKPLLSVLGLSLVERVILTAEKSGLTEFYVVTGYNGQEVRRFLDKFSKERNIKINHILNEEWQKENGVSVLEAKNLLNENFILLMADHIFDESILLKLKNEKVVDDQIMLAVDYDIKTNKLVDVDDATKVLVEGNTISEIGKNIKKYNAYDTGIFLCSPAIFGAIEESLHEGDSSLSGGIRVMAKKGKVKALDIEDGYWIDVDDEERFKKAEKLLRSKLTKPSDGLISLYINRKFSINIFTPLLLRIHKRITPNQVSILSFFVSLISGLFFFLGHAILGGLLIQISSILDGCDGEIARLKDMQSPLGNFIDAILDRYADGFMLLGMLYYSLSMIGRREIFDIYWSPLIIITVSVLAILGNLMVSYTSAKSVVNFNYLYRGRGIAAGRGRDLRLFLLFIGGIMTYFHPISVFLAMFIIALQTNIIVLWRTLLSWNYSVKKHHLVSSKIKAVIFDFDGVIANSMSFLTELAVELITKHYNISKEEARRRYLETTGLDFSTQIELIFPDHPSNKKVTTIFESRKREGIFAHPIFSDVIPTLSYFRNKKIITIICSSTKQEIITRYSQSNKIDNLTDEIFGYKPNFGKDRQIDFVLRHLKNHPNEVLFVGDSLRDYDFVKDKKINFVGISRIFDKAEFQKRGILSVGSLTELIKLFDKYEKTFEFLHNATVGT